MGSRGFVDEPNMSDTTILMNLEDLINIAMGPAHKNTVNFKLIQTILHILARQMRMLETNVELRVQEIKDMSPERYTSPRKKAYGYSTDDVSSSRRKEKSDVDRDRKGRDKADKKTGKEAAKGEKGKIKGGKDEKEMGKEGKTHRDDKDAGKETSKFEKGKHRDKDKERGGRDDEAPGARSRSRGRDKTSATSITITEKQRGKEKVLAVEKGAPSRTDSKTKVGSIEVVTQSQFENLKAAINELKSIAGPIPIPELPDNDKLRSDLAKGSASLTDTMQAMQVTARLKAAEKAIGRMAGLLTALSAAGALPEDLLDKFGGRFYEDTATADIAADATSTKSTPRKSVAIGVDVETMSDRASSPARSEPSRKSLAVKKLSAAKSTMATVSKVGSMSRRTSIMSKQSALSDGALALVTYQDMDEALQQLKEDLSKNVTNMTTKATAAAETAVNTTRVVAERMDIALKLNARISTLNSLVSDYAEQLSGFDTGLSTQMVSFQEQIGQIRADLKEGLTQLEQINNNAETAAIVELSERYEELVSALDRTTYAHQGLTAFQKQLSDELHNLVECVEGLREQKADRDEVLDGLRDKADNTRLTGLLTEVEFALARDQIDKRLEICYDKFKKQEAVWMLALDDLKHVAEMKAEFMQLLGMKEDTKQELQELHELLKQLTVILGEPKAAILTRKLAKDASCGVCLVPAMMDPLDANYGAPPPLPAMRPKPTGAPAEEAEPGLMDRKLPQPPDRRDHTCHRWVGGSHTLISESVKREQAPPLHVQATPTKKYVGYGADGRLYMLEEDLQPCIECNILKPNSDREQAVSIPPITLLSEGGAGDQGYVAF